MPDNTPNIERLLGGPPPHDIATQYACINELKDADRVTLALLLSPTSPVTSQKLADAVQREALTRILLQST